MSICNRLSAILLLSFRLHSIRQFSRRGVGVPGSANRRQLLGCSGLLVALIAVGLAHGVCSAQQVDRVAPAAQVTAPELPDRELVVTYEKAAVQNVLAAVNPQVFPGYFCVCADGQGFGYGNSYPSLDGHQMCDALLWLGDVETVKLNWQFVRGFQQPSGRLPLAILPTMAGQQIGSAESKSPVDANGGLYVHWVPGNPLAALASPTFIQNADVIYRHTLDRAWLESNMDAVNLAADYLTSLMTPEGLVQGAGYYIERPTRIASDGVAQCYAIDAYQRVAALNRAVGRDADSERYEALARRVRTQFTQTFWTGDHFAEYLHPERGLIASHGLTDVDWAALATGVATPEQIERIWPQLRTGDAFYFGGMPTAISTKPDSYEDWEFTHPDRHDLSAMGRVWYLEAWARSRMQDADGLVRTLLRVAQEGERQGYYWRERYYPTTGDTPVGAGAEKYCEYPANLVRIVNEFLFGVDLQLDGAVLVAPVAPDRYWQQGFGHRWQIRGSTLELYLKRDRIELTYVGPQQQRLGLRMPGRLDASDWKPTSAGTSCPMEVVDGTLWLTLPASSAALPMHAVWERKTP